MNMRCFGQPMCRSVFDWLRLATAVALIVVSAAAPGFAQAPTDDAPQEPAVAAAAPPARSLLQVLRAGGPVMIPIAFCSFLLMVFVLERAVSLRRSRVIPKPFVKRFLAQIREGQLERDSALDLCEENGSPISKVFAAATKKWGRSSVEVEQAIIDSGERVTNELRKFLRLFNSISTVSPLLGLLGTVFGMINAFNVIATADAMGRPDMLAGGISEALITTAAGLTVAIPALIAYWIFVSKVDRLIMDIDGYGQQLVELIAADARPADGARAAAKTARREKAA